MHKHYLVLSWYDIKAVIRIISELFNILQLVLGCTPGSCTGNGCGNGQYCDTGTGNCIGKCFLLARFLIEGLYI